MFTQKQVMDLAVESPARIVMVVADGIGGLPDPVTGKTELETASTPNLDRLAHSGMCGLHEPVSPGITPGSGPGHLSLFGYDPVDCLIGRGVLEGLGIDFPLQGEDVAARGNFCTIDSAGAIVDRRAGRVATEKSAELCALLGEAKLDGAEVFVRPVREHRFLVVFRGKGLSADLEDTDPGRTGVPVPEAKALSKDAGATARLVQAFVNEAGGLLAGREPANMVLLRGFSKLPDMPLFGDVYRLKPAAIVVYPMYRGLARVLGMRVFDGGGGLADQVKVLKEQWDNFNFFFIHFKKTDAAGEDGNFAMKTAAIEELDAGIAEILPLKPDVIAVTGDHSTPALLKAHSWHPVPLLINSRWCRFSGVERFGEGACARGNLGILPGQAIMPLLMAHALKLTKYGA